MTAVLTRNRFALAILLALTLTVGLAPAPARAATPLSRHMLALTNDSRDGRHRDVLEIDERLSRIALRHSRAMAKEGELFHSTDLPKALGSVEWTRWGENVGYTTGSLEDLHRAFMRSRDHKRNILERSFEKVGIGVVRRDGEIWATLIFYG